jgi:HEAT repeat protein
MARVRVSRSWWRAALPLAALLLAGCAGGSEQNWSSKDQSVLGRREPQQQLAVDPHVISGPARGDLRTAARDMLVAGASAADPLVRANAIEGLQAAPEYLDQVMPAALADHNRGVRFVAAMTIGQLRIQHLAHLLEPLLDDPSESVRAAAIFGLRRTGRAVDLTPLAAMLASPDPEVKANAAMVLGKLGDPTALPMLRVALGEGMERVSPQRAKMVDLQIAEAMVKLGSERELEGIRAALFVPVEQGELTALACQICGRLRDERVLSMMMDLVSRTGPRRPPAEVRMSAALALAQLRPEAAPVGVPLEYAANERPELRAQAAFTLGAMGRAEGLPTLASLMADSSPVVQVTAAAAILLVPAN